MEEQWIDAATARRLVANVTVPPHRAGEALCKRAHAGLVRARARAYFLGDSSQTQNCVVPRGFWWAEGQAALKQNWEAGDFSTWAKQNIELRAFGVTFALSDVLQMLPVDQRANVARQVSVLGNAAWMTSRAALELASDRSDLSPEAAGSMIGNHGWLGFVLARAVLAQGYDGGKIGEPSWEEREWDVPASFWRRLAEEETSAQDWKRGVFSATHPESGWLTDLTGVHFLAESIEALFPESEPKSRSDNAQVEASSKATHGGRPAAAWWDDMWCEVWGQIYEGKLIPQTQADVERAMLTWAEDQGHSPAVSTVRLKARKLFHVFSRGENSSAS